MDMNTQVSVLPSWVDSLTLVPSLLSLAAWQHQNEILCQFIITHIQEETKGAQKI